MDKKEEIIKWIKKLGKLPTSRISGLVGLNPEYTKKYLEELLKENKVKKIEETTATYWEIKK